MGPPNQPCCIYVHIYQSYSGSSKQAKGDVDVTRAAAADYLQHSKTDAGPKGGTLPSAVAQPETLVADASATTTPTQADGKEGTQPLQDTQHSPIVVSLRRTSDGFGLMLMGSRRKGGQGIFISGVRPGSPADEHPDIQPGLQLLQLNGIEMGRATTMDAIAILKTAEDTLRLTLKKNEKVSVCSVC